MIRISKVKALSKTQLLVQDITVELTRKNIKNLNLRITQPEGQVRVSAPKKTSIDVIYAFVVSRYNWILLQQEKIQAQANQNTVTYDTGEKLCYFGRQFELLVVDCGSKPDIVINEHLLELNIHANSTYEQRQKVVENWYRCQLKNQIPLLVKKYEFLMNLQVQEFGVKKMKTRWGTCNPAAKRIWLNLELAKKPIECLEYVVLHEMTHFLEPKHNQRFYDFVTKYMPSWKMAEQKLS